MLDGWRQGRVGVALELQSATSCRSDTTLRRSWDDSEDSAAMTQRGHLPRVQRRTMHRPLCSVPGLSYSLGWVRRGDVPRKIGHTRKSRSALRSRVQHAEEGDYCPEEAPVYQSIRVAIVVTSLQLYDLKYGALHVCVVRNKLSIYVSQNTYAMSPKSHLSILSRGSVLK